MKRVLLYSPDVVGHPRVYCRVIADALAGEECEVILAMGFSVEAELKDCPDILPLVGRPGIAVLDTRTVSARGVPHLRAEEIGELQERERADVTLFIEADKSNTEFRRIGAGEARRLRGRNIGIFANTAEWYPGEDSNTGRKLSLLAPTLKTTLGNVKRAILERRSSPRFYYEKVIIDGHVLDEVLVKDERLAAWRGAPVHWMPEISRPVAVEKTSAEMECYEDRRRELEVFLRENAGREPILYFGDGAYYKGYDLFLQFAASTASTCAIHAGRPFDERQKGWCRYDVDALREHLRGEGRLYETREYVHSQRLKELYFGAVRLYLTTHRLALSSSTVIQALELGKPVLVPDRGLLGHRVRTNGLGGVYRYEDVDDLRRVAGELWSSDLDRFAEPARRYWQRFSDLSIREFFRSRLLAGSGDDEASR